MGVVPAKAIPDTPPHDALIQRYVDSGDYTDCFVVELDRPVALADLIEAFYTSAVFRPERWVLALIGKGGNDAGAHALAMGLRERYAAWTVEDRTEDQILMCDFQKATRSWLMVHAMGPGRTRIWFGSVVVKQRKASGEKVLSPLAAALMGFHTAYSKALLNSTAKRLKARR